MPLLPIDGEYIEDYFGIFPRHRFASIRSTRVTLELAARLLSVSAEEANHQFLNNEFRILAILENDDTAIVLLKQDFSWWLYNVPAGALAAAYVSRSRPVPRILY